MFTVIGGLLVGTILGTGFLAAGAPVAFKESLASNPDIPKKRSLFTSVTPGRTKLLMRGGEVVAHLYGTNPYPYLSPESPLWWNQYKKWVWDKFSLHVLNPVTDERVYSYELPHYRVSEKDGVKIFTAVTKGDEGFRSDHVRTEPFTWYVNFAGVEIESVAFTVKASAQVRIIPGMEEDALFGTESWNVFLDQVLNSVVRGVVRSKVTIDEVIGRVENVTNVFQETKAKKADYGELEEKISETVRAYTLEIKEKGKEEPDHKSLRDFGIDVLSFEIVDFEPELTDEELAKLRSAALALREARATALRGKGDAAARLAQGQADAKAKKAVAAALNKYPDYAQMQVDADALVAMSKNGQVDAILAGLLKTLMKGK